MKIIIDLQFFAGEDKTEKATPKRRQDAREKGQVVQSRELTSAAILMFTFIGIKFLGDYLIKNFKLVVTSPFAYFKNVDNVFKINNINLYMTEVFKSVILIAGPIFIVVAAVALIANYLQVGFLFTTKTLEPKLEKLNPMEGFKRMFSGRALLELFKSLAKLILLGYVAYSYLSSQSSSITRLYDMSVEGILIFIAQTAYNIVLRMGVVLFAIAIVDYIYQWKSNEKNLRMSKQEIKEEYKQSEGNPEIKAKIKQKQRQIAMRRMMQDVPKADVVITNPTHFAVAIKYDSEKNAAPIVVAKGQDYLAQRIKQIAKENSVEIVENRPLARSLYANTDIGDVIPTDLYQAVAEVLAYVYSLKSR